MIDNNQPTCYDMTIWQLTLHSSQIYDMKLFSVIV